jgi:uncharacterized protein YdeI (YjbR/CyaY-like superfamily)
VPSRLGIAELGTLDVPEASKWRSWLGENHLTSQGVWLVYHRSGSRVPSISYDESVDEALAFGWIDSIIRRIDGEKYARKFTPRRPGSVWSKFNIARVERLRKEGRMTKWGLEAFQKRTGEVSLLERFNARGARAVEVPEDFEKALQANARAWANFQRMAPSHRKRYLLWIAGAKKAETRKRRISEAVVLVGKNVKNLLR